MSQPPTPRHAIGDRIAFDRSHLEYAKDEGRLVGVVHSIELYLTNSRVDGCVPGEWSVSYYTEHDNPIPEGCVLTPKDCPLSSIATVMATSPRDWSLCSEDAWLYGIALGWDEALPEVTKKHKWRPITVDRLQRLRARWVELEAMP
jgi:hypothetical protein